MDRLIVPTRRRAAARLWQRAAPFVVVVAVTFGVAMLVPAGLYLAQRHMADAPRRAGDPVAAGGSAPLLPPPVASAVLFRSVHVVDVEVGAVRPPADVLVEQGRIAAIGPALSLPAEATVVDGAGRYLMPGLVDTHVHLTRSYEPLLFVAAGVTTVQSLGGPLEQNLATGEAIRRGEQAGPRIASCDAVVPGGLPASEAERQVAGALARGAECIKIYSPPDWTREAHAALIAAARARGLRIGGHLPRNLPLADGLGHGQQFVAHAEEYLYAHFQKLPGGITAGAAGPAVDLTKQSGTVVIPTLVAYRSIVDEVGPAIVALMAKPELRYVPRDVAVEWGPDANRYRQRFTEADGEQLARAFAFQQVLVKAWADAGVPLALGTDSSVRMPFIVPGFSALEELRALREAGVPAADVLRAATTNGARMLGRGDRIGRVAIGMDADLILIEGDPLADVANVARRQGVMAQGRWMPEAWLQRQLAQLAGR